MTKVGLAPTLEVSDIFLRTIISAVGSHITPSGRNPHFYFCHFAGSILIH